jgi:virginiamycin A acetyltransferase
MKNEIYKYYTTVFGHSKFLNVFINKMSDTSINMADSISIGRGTQLMGDVTLGENVSISKDSTINGTVDIEKNVSIKSNVHISGNVDIHKFTNLHERNWVRGNAEIGKFCAIGPRVRMLSYNHEINKPGMQGSLYGDLGLTLGRSSEGPIKIGNDVWIGSDAKILQNVKIGNGAVIGANSVVVDNVEPYSIVVGNPAVHKKYRFNESKRNELQEIAWWDWNMRKRKQNKKFFDADLTDVDDITSLIE